MKNSQTKTTGVLLAVAIFAIYLFFAPTSANARFKDRSDELPGMDSNAGTYLLIAAGAVAILGIVAIVKHNKANAQKKTDEDKADSTKSESDANNSSQNEAKSAETMIKTTEAAEKSQLGLYIDMDQSDNSLKKSKAFDFSDLTLKAGVSLSF